MNLLAFNLKNAFRARTWHFGVRLPHQGKRECARRVARALGKALGA